MTVGRVGHDAAAGGGDVAPPTPQQLRRALARVERGASLDVDSENPTGALGLYERAGFRTDRRWTNYASEG